MDYVPTKFGDHIPDEGAPCFIYLEERWRMGCLAEAVASVRNPLAQFEWSMLSGELRHAEKSDLYVLMEVPDLVEVPDSPGTQPSRGAPMLNVNPFINLKFQEGSVGEVGVNGCQTEDVLELLIERTREFNLIYSCLENEWAIQKMAEARMWLNERTHDRVARGVEGKRKL